MPHFYIGTDVNKMGCVQTDDKTGELIKVTMYPAASSPEKIKTQGGTYVLVGHPSLPLVVALTSGQFSLANKQQTVMTCFQQNRDKSVGNQDLTVERLFDCPTAGRLAVHAMFHPKCRTLAVAHHNDSMVSLFQFSESSLPTSTTFLEQQPVAMLELPEVTPGTKKTLQATDKGNVSVPSCHHAFYAPNGKFLLCVDPNQSTIFTYPVDPQTGLPTQQEPSSTLTCHTDAPCLGWFSATLSRFVLGFGKSPRPRMVAISPNHKYVYVNYEIRNVIQVYAIDEDTGEIAPDPIQEVSTLDKELTSQTWIGLGVQSCANMVVMGHSLYVSNRGEKILGAGRCERSVRIYDIRDGGRLATHHAVACSGSVQHFVAYRDGDDDVLVAGTKNPGNSLQTFRRRSSGENKDDDPSPTFQLVGEADVGISVEWVITPPPTS